MSRRLAVAVLLTLAAVVAAGCSVPGVGGPRSYSIRVEFPTALGLYPGSFVRQLGIDVGSVSNVVNRGDHVVATLKIKHGDKLAPNADAVLVANSVLGERFVQFVPAYTGGPSMPAGTVLPLSRVTVPVETDTVLRSLNTVLRGINPVDVKQFTASLAQVLRGNGEKLNDLIANAAGTVTLLAQKSQDLGQLTTTLAQLSTQLDTRDQALASLIRDYDLLSQTLAADRSQVDGVITQLTDLTTQATGLLAPNLRPIKADVADLTAVGQTLDRNIKAVDIGLHYAPLLFAAAARSYDPQHNWLPLNSQAPPGETTAILTGNVRDALASVCRRLAAKNPALAPVLAQCGNPSSGFFDPILGLVPSVINQLPGGSANRPAAPPSSATDALAQGLAAIPGLTPAQRQQLGQVGSAPAPSAPPTTSSTSTTSTTLLPLPPTTLPIVGGVPGPIGGVGHLSSSVSGAAVAPGAAAVAALAATPRGAVPPASAPKLRPARTHHRGLLGRLVHWLGGLL